MMIRFRFARGGFGVYWIILTLVLSSIPVAAQTEKIPRVGFLCWVTCGDEYHEAFWQSLRKLGYHDYRNITFDNRAAGGDGASLDTLALQLVGLKPTVIVADTTQSARALKNLTKTLPLVVIADDPVGSGFTSNLARPDGNITGLSSVAAELGVIQLQLLKEVVPTASRVAVIGNPINPATKLRMEAMQTAARASGISLLSIEVRNPTEHESAFAAITQMHANAVIDILGGADRSNSATTARVLQLAMKHQLPAIYQSEDLVAEGGLMSYGPNVADEFRRAANYVDKILRGAKPADLPVEEPTNFELVINLKTVKALGLVVPPSLAARADRFIE